MFCLSDCVHHLFSTRELKWLQLCNVRSLYLHCGFSEAVVEHLHVPLLLLQLLLQLRDPSLQPPLLLQQRWPDTHLHRLHLSTDCWNLIYTKTETNNQPIPKNGPILMWRFVQTKWHWLSRDAVWDLISKFISLLLSMSSGSLWCCMVLHKHTQTHSVIYSTILIVPMLVRY